MRRRKSRRLLGKNVEFRGDLKKAKAPSAKRGRQDTKERAPSNRRSAVGKKAPPSKRAKQTSSQKRHDGDHKEEMDDKKAKLAKRGSKRSTRASSGLTTANASIFGQTTGTANIRSTRSIRRQTGAGKKTPPSKRAKKQTTEQVEDCDEYTKDDKKVKVAKRWSRRSTRSSGGSISVESAQITRRSTRRLQPASKKTSSKKVIKKTPNVPIPGPRRLRSGKKRTLKSESKSSVDSDKKKKRAKTKHLVQGYRINERADALFRGGWFAVKIMEAYERDHSFYYRVNWIRDSKAVGQTVSSILPESQLRSPEMALSVQSTQSHLEEDSKHDNHIGAGLGLLYDDPTSPSRPGDLMNGKVEVEEKVPISERQTPNLGPSPNISSMLADPTPPPVHSSLPPARIPLTPVDIKTYYAVLTMSLVGFLVGVYIGFDVVVMGLGAAAMPLYVLGFRGLGDSLVIGVVLQGAKLWGIGVWWETEAVRVLGEVCQSAYLCDDTFFPASTVFSTSQKIISVCGEPYILAILGILLRWSQKLALPRIFLAMVGVVILSAALFVGCNALISIIYWLGWDPVSGLVGSFISLTTTLDFQGSVESWTLYRCARLTVLLLWGAAISRLWRVIMLVAAHLYVHFVRAIFIDFRARGIHKYAKATTDAVPSYLMGIHLNVLKSMDNPFRAKVDANSFMVGRDSKSSGLDCPDSWFGLVSLHAKKEKLAGALANYHDIPVGTLLREFKRTPLQVDREQLFDSVAEQILAAEPSDLAAGINVKFDNEIGIDSGGLTKEFFSLVCRGILPRGRMIDQSYRRTRRPLMRRQSSVRGVGEPMLRALPDTSLIVDVSNRPIVFYKALGRVFGMCFLYNVRRENTFVPVSLSTALLKFILGREINHFDVRALDPDYFKHRIEFMLKPGGVEIMCSILDVDNLYFEDFDKKEELKSGGSKISVSEQNKMEYVTLLSEHYLCGNVRKQLCQFLQGFHEIVPQDLLQRFNIDETDLSLILSGNPKINLEDWKAHAMGNVAEYYPQLATWFWECLEEMSMNDRARILQFATGLTRLPPTGFADLVPSFKIDLNNAVDHTHLPTSHTCFNTLCLPPYETKLELQEKLKKALTMASGEFEYR